MVTMKQSDKMCGFGLFPENLESEILLPCGHSGECGIVVICSHLMDRAMWVGLTESISNWWSRWALHTVHRLRNKKKMHVEFTNHMPSTRVTKEKSMCMPIYISLLTEKNKNGKEKLAAAVAVSASPLHLIQKAAIFIYHFSKRIFMPASRENLWDPCVTSRT